MEINSQSIVNIDLKFIWRFWYQVFVKFENKSTKARRANRRHFKNYAFSKENVHLFTSKHLIKTFYKNFWIVYQSCGKIIYTWCEIVILIIINSCSLKAGFIYSRLCNYFLILLIPIFFETPCIITQITIIETALRGG